MKTPSPLRPHRGLPRSSRGALLIVAMLLAAIIAIGLGSYIALSINSLKLANRTFYNGGSINLAETGCEEALWAFNQETAGVALATAWAGWDISDGVTAKRTFTDFTLAGNVQASVKVYVDHYAPAASVQPKAVAYATITLPNESRTMTKMIELTLRRRSKFAMGLVAKNQITFNGNNASVDSWNSHSDTASTLDDVPYSAAVKNDHGSVGSTSVAVGSVAINNADIWGFASVGSSSSSGISVGNAGTVAAFGNPAGTIDTTRIATDFTANFDSTTTPAGASVNTIAGGINGGDLPLTIPRAGDTSSGGTYYYSLSSLSSAGNATNVLTIAANKKVVFLFTAGAGTSAVSMTGNSSIAVSAGAELQIYTAGDVKIAGNGVANANSNPASLQIWGTSTSATAQQVDIAGNGALKAIVYAPTADVKINGNGDVMGSIVGNNITVVGNATFHYDESLANWGGNNPYGVVKWRELVTATDRATYTTAMSGW